MAAFIKLDDSPMFQKQVRSLEETAEELRDRCQKLYKGSTQFMDALGQAWNGDILFSESLESFGGGQDDPISVSIGGPIISKFITAFRELATHKELLRSQVEHMLVDRLTQFLSVDLQDAKESRRRFDKAINAYDQARERFASLKKSTRDEVVAELEEDLHNSKSAFERSRFNLVHALTNVEAKKKYEFLESFSAIMDAHLRYFKLGYELLSQMEPFIHQVLTYTQQTKEQANIEQDKLAKRIQEFRTQRELDQMRASSNLGTSTSSLGNGVGLSSDKNIEAIMQTSAEGQVQTIKQGYLLKRSSSLRADWKRRFFVLDGRGTLYYYRHKGAKPAGFQSSNSITSVEQNSGVFGRLRSRYHRAPNLSEDNVSFHTVDLRTSTIKIDAEDTDLRLCFRIISPCKTYTLQAENEADRTDWMNKITGVIASLLNSHLQQLNCGIGELDKKNSSRVIHFDARPLESTDNKDDSNRFNHAGFVSKILREIRGNDQCAECGAPEPDWASLNLGVLMCIECSGIHRNLGVHISKVRSINLDVKVWEPVVLDLFQTLGNEYCNSIWEGLLLLQNNENSLPSITKPSPGDSVYQKETYINAKYVQKLLVSTPSNGLSPATSIWEAVRTNNVREVYRLIATSHSNIVNSTYDEVVGSTLNHTVNEHGIEQDPPGSGKRQFDHASCLKIKSFKETGYCLQGCSLLHLACHLGNPVMLELLLQFGADINRCDFHGRTPLEHCVSEGNNELAKVLLRRGACASIKDGGGFNALERAMEMGAITDDELFVLLSESI